MLTKIIIPKIGYTMEEAMVVKWLKNEGDPVKAGDAVLEIASDKANIEIEAPAGGILLKILTAEGESIPVLQAAGYIGEANDALPGEDKPVKQDLPAVTVEKIQDTPAANTKDNRANRLSPRARKFAREHALDEKDIGPGSGTGYNGLIVERDVAKLLDVQKTGFAKADAEYITPSSYKQVTAKRLTQSVRDIPQFVTGAEVNAESLLRLKDRLQEAAAARISMTGLLVKCAACAIRDHMRSVNVSWADGKIALHPNIRIGVAVATDKGLVVAVVADPERKSLTEIALELKMLSEKAREGKLPAEEMTGSTFTISNLGMYEVDQFEAIVNPPESGILAVGRIIRKPVALKDDAVAVKPMMFLNLTSDHRVLDGADAAKFIGAIKKYIEFPELML